MGLLLCCLSGVARSSWIYNEERNEDVFNLAAVCSVVKGQLVFHGDCSIAGPPYSSFAFNV